MALYGVWMVNKFLGSLGYCVFVGSRATAWWKQCLVVQIQAGHALGQTRTHFQDGILRCECSALSAGVEFSQSNTGGTILVYSGAQSRYQLAFVQEDDWHNQERAFYSGCDRIQNQDIFGAREVCSKRKRNACSRINHTPAANVSHSANVSQPEKRQKTQPIVPGLDSRVLRASILCHQMTENCKFLKLQSQAMWVMPIIWLYQNLQRE